MDPAEIVVAAPVSPDAAGAAVKIAQIDAGREIAVAEISA
jgi:hypothetical protein